MDNKVKLIGHDINRKEVGLDAAKMAFRPSVYGVLIEDDKVLLSKQWDGWDLPGGGMRIDETIEQALRREFWEETGLNIEMKQVIACEHDFFLHPFSGSHLNCPLMYFLCNKLSGELTTDNFDENEKEYADLAEWVFIEDINKLKFYGPSSAAVNAIYKGKMILDKK